ncbi:unnamed protein product [Linum trigynum]|uniref:RNase H type-1 domain-containing protein n=1 Tax=Linum trigynum TaxID=586398 RepID=A0AAV2G2R1_9ROSI
MTPSRVVLRAIGVQFPVLDDPTVVELLALREAILWCLGQGLAFVRFEGDAKLVIDKIRRADTGDSRMGVVLEEVVNHFDSNPGFSVRFVGRRNNRVAYLVARKALSVYPTMSRAFNFQAWLISRM